MKKPSRFMPAYVPAKPGIAWVLVVISFILALTIFQPVVFVVITVIFLLSYSWSLLIEAPRNEKYFDTLQKSRRGESICKFAREFDTGKVDTWVIRAVYEQIQSWIPTNLRIPIRASDNLFNDLKLDEDDLDMELVDEIAQRTGRSLEDCASNPYYGKVHTAGDLVYFFNEQPKMN